MRDTKRSNLLKAPIIGMDIFTPQFPDMLSFKRALLTGNIIAGQPLNFTESPKQDLKITECEDDTLNIPPSLFPTLLSLVVNRALEDTRLSATNIDQGSLGVVIHGAPFHEKEVNSVKLDWEEGVVKQGVSIRLEACAKAKVLPSNTPFSQVILHALSMLKNEEFQQIAICSLFNCAILALPREEKPHHSDRGDHIELAGWGAGCLVVSDSLDPRGAYAHIVYEYTDDSKNVDKEIGSVIGTVSLLKDSIPWWNDSKEDQLYTALVGRTISSSDCCGGQYLVESLPRAEKADNPARFFELPIIRLIRSALSLNSRTYFSMINYENNNGSNDAAGAQSVIMRPWFLTPYMLKRESETLIEKSNDGVAMLWLQKEANDELHQDNPFNHLGLFMLPVEIAQEGQVEKAISSMEKAIEMCDDLIGFVRGFLISHNEKKTDTFTLVLLGRDKRELLSELAYARVGVQRAFQKGIGWQTPSGSYFTPNPLATRGRIAFVYPGAFGTYVGMGREIFYLFPQLHDDLAALTSDPSQTINEQIFYSTDVTPNQIDRLQNDLKNNPILMISSGICFSYLYTVILRDIFNVQPQAAFGYSLGEVSMMFALGVWSQADAMRTSLEVSPVFRERVSGPQNAIREFWNLPTLNADQVTAPIWTNMVLLASFEQVQKIVEQEDRVYITHINTPSQVVIGGEPIACQRVALALKCMYLEAPYHHAIHCPPVESEFDEFMRLHNWPIEQKPNIPIYSAANYHKMDFDSPGIARGFAEMLTKPIDFPQLVNNAYQDGVRIFIELGAGSNCSKWVSSTLKGRPHLSLSINANQACDHVTILALLARLISHQVPMRLNTLVD